MRRNLSLWKKFIIAGGLFLFIAGGWGMLFLKKEKEAILAVDKSGYVRLHILANSDSLKDQELKIKVRDAVIAYLTPFVKDAADANEAKEIIAARKGEILKVSGQVIAENGGNYPVSMEIGNFDFPIRTYGALVLPEGNYQAVRLLIGEGSGKNWWCVLFPPLCFIDGSTVRANPLIKKDSPEQNNNPEIEIRWKIVELFK